jgi:primary-amine oxidase
LKAHPVDGLVLEIDLFEKKMEIIEMEEQPEVPLIKRNYSQEKYLIEHPKSKLRTSLMPIQITQPKGPSFKVKGNLIEWENWSFRAGFFMREGLVLQNMKFYKRPVCYRASVAEMVVRI